MDNPTASISDKVPNLKWRKSKDREDSRKAAKKLEENTDIEPYDVDQLTSLIRSSAKAGELSFRKSGRTREITNLGEWFETRVLPNTMSLTQEDYFTALANSFELLTVGDPAKTDFGSSRQREFGQQWTDFTRGYLGEIAIKQFFSERFGLDVSLRQRDTEGELEEYLPTDLTQVKTDDGEFRKTEQTISVKTTKLRALWLGIPGNEIGHSSAFTLVKIGIPLDHLAIFLKETNALDELLSHIDEDNAEEILDAVPKFEDIPAYIPGFAWKKDFQENELEEDKARKKVHITGGIGQQPEEPPDGYSEYHVEGIGSLSEEFIGATGALRWETDEWESLVAKL